MKRISARHTKAMNTFTKAKRDLLGILVDIRMEVTSNEEAIDEKVQENIELAASGDNVNKQLDQINNILGDK
jgi:hypothetical protein